MISAYHRLHNRKNTHKKIFLSSESSGNEEIFYKLSTKREQGYFRLKKKEIIIKYL